MCEYTCILLKQQWSIKWRRGDLLSIWSSKHGTQPQGGYQEELDIPSGEPHGRWSSGLSDISLHYHGEYEGRSGDTGDKEREGHPATVYCTEEGAQGLPGPDGWTQRMSHGVHSGQIRKLCMNVECPYIAVKLSMNV